jgi:magnesium transporter
MDEERALAEALTSCASYTAGTRDLRTDTDTTALHSDRPTLGGFVWLDLKEPDEAALQSVARQYGLHPLAIEDAVFGHQRPKLESYGDMTFVVLRTAHYVDQRESVETGELMLFIGMEFVVSVWHGFDPGLTDVRSDLEARPEILRVGPPAVVYAVLDRIVDDVSEAVEVVLDEVEDTESRVFAPGRERPTDRIYMLTQEVLRLRQALEPLMPVVTGLANGRLSGVDGIAPCFRDVQDHVARAYEQVLAMEQLLVNDLAANQARVTSQQNEDLRKISAWVAILAFSTLVAGIYGMNFANMPELRWQLGYPLVLCVMAAASVTLFVGFKRNHWL